MLTKKDVQEILGNVTYKDWRFRVLTKGDGFLIQAVFFEPDCHTGKPTEQHGRKWYVSSHSCRSEVVQTAWAAVERAVLHEAKEAFLYRGERIMNPHLDVEQLVVFAGNRFNEEVREDTRTKCLGGLGCVGCVNPYAAREARSLGCTCSYGESDEMTRHAPLCATKERW